MSSLSQELQGPAPPINNVGIDQVGPIVVKTMVNKRTKMKIRVVIFYGICSFLPLTGIWGVENQPPESSDTTKHMTMKFLPDAKLSKEAGNQKKN